MKPSQQHIANAWEIHDLYWSSYLIGDTDTLSSIIDEDYKQIGSVENEVFENKKDALQFIEDTLDQIMGKVEMRNRVTKTSPIGDLILISEICDLYVNDSDSWTFYSRFRATSLLQHKNGGWKLIQQHSSIPDSKTDAGESIATEKISKENLDLKNAIKRRTAELENKNRELEIEAALEKVRAAAMSMSTPEDLRHIGEVIFSELKTLGFSHLRNTEIIINRDDKQSIVSYYYSDYGVSGRIKVDSTSHPKLKKWAEDLKTANDGFAAVHISKKELDEWKKFREELGYLPDHKLEEAESLDYYSYSTGLGALSISSFKPISAEQMTTLERFRNVFGLAYRRYVDVAQAEAQAREAQIELALERVRARTMAMQHSDELTEASEVLDEQVRALGIQSWGSAFHIYADDAEGDYEWFNSREGTLPFYKTPREKFFLTFYNKGKAGETFHVEEFIGDDCRDHYEYLMTLPVIGDALREIVDAGGSLPDSQYDHVAFFKHGYVLFITYEPVPDAHDIFKRFAKVFEQTYTRFLDLQKAEAQTRKAQIELSLERIRAQVTAMQESSDLLDIVVTMRTEFVRLGHEAHYFWHMRWLPEHYKKAMTSGDGTRIGMVMTLPRHIHGDIETVAKWEKGDDPTHVLAMDVETAVVYLDKMISLGDFEQVDPQAPTLDDIRKIGGLTFIMARTTHGEIGYSLPGVVPDPPKDAVNTLVRFAGVFDLAYRRFEDLKKTEAQARETQVELTLERIRARTMAMQNSEELADVAFVLFEQLRELGGNLWGTGFGLCERNSDKDSFWFANENGVFPPVSIPNTTDPAHQKMYDGWKAGKDFLAIEASGDDLKSHYDYMLSLPEVKPFFQKIVDEGLSLPEWQQWNAAYFKHGYLLIITLEPYPDPDILVRFAKVFEQTYTRFLDLKKAEAQAREAQIEAALERLRAKAMSMHHSDELDEVLAVLCEQFDILGILPMSAHMTVLDIEHNKFTFRETGKFGNRSFGEQTVALDAMDTWKDMVESWKNADPYSINSLHFPKETLPQVWEVFHESFASMPEGSRITPDDYPDGIYHTAGKHPYGYIGMNQTRKATEEEEQIVIKFANEFGRAYTRFLDLKKAEAQAREAQIETALEKVRSRTMAMQKGKELQDVAVLLYKELIALGVTDFVSCGYVEVNEDIKTQDTWITSPGGDTMGLFHLPLTGDETFDERYAAWKNQQPIFHQSVAGKVRSDHLEYAITKFNSKEAEEMVRSQFPDPTVFYCFNFPHGYLHIVAGSLLEKEEENLLARFTKVFEQTYTRFLDLKKAEVQAREANIEMSLEKIRSRTMGMQSSDELPEVANLLFLEVQELGIPAWSCGYCILTEDRKASTCIMSSEGTIQKPFLLPHLGEPSFEEWDDFVHGDQTFFTQELKGEAIDSHYNFMKSLPQLKPVFQDLVDAGLSLPTYQINHLCKFSHGFLLFITYEPVPDAHDIFKRFTNVFDQTYTRFLDLKKAEAQAREAQIGNALEKVRSRSLAMQNPDELIEVAQLLREEMGALGVEELETSSIYIHDESSGLTQCWFTIKDADDPNKSVTDQMTIALQNTWVGRQMDEFYRSNQDKASILMKGDRRIEWIRYCEEKSDLFGNSEFYGETIPERTYHLYKFSNGFLGAASPGDISDESWSLMKRATGVFSFAYTRFIDLQKAEESARRSRQQAALDRVRADISSMRSADDLNRVTPLVWRELNTLGIPFIRCGVFIIHKDEQEVEVYLSKPDGTSLAVMHLPFNSNELVTQTVESWRNKEVHTQHWSREEFLDWGHSMMEQNQVPDMETYQGAKEAPESLHLHFIPFNQGMLYVGSTDPLTYEEIDLAESLAKAFSIAYARYEDFVKLEKAKAKIEEALTELKATQSQLIQQEKLASLGQLTAGIAHEIKNPLNFVNNFSDLSVELIEEAKEEVRIQGSGVRSDQSEILELLDNIKMNLLKIHEHGSRADSIVKSMLEHSRGGSGKMEPTNLNAIVKEFTNLSFHGMRASKNPINVDMEFELDESVGEVPLVIEDFSRVMVNVCNNAFDAMREKETRDRRPETDEAYVPKLTVRTHQKNSTVIIKIEDNGPGISDEIKDKILQPFFTTKKGTAGTGLGLSITNDIIKAHGGTLNVISPSKGGTIFTISLPV